MHHQNSSPCPLCEQKKTLSHPGLLPWINAVQTKHPDVHVSWSYRNEEDQNRAFEDGESKLRFPASAHNKTDSDGKPCSRAMDLFQLDDDFIARFNPIFLAKVCEESTEMGFRLLWGGVWKSLGDYCHFELPMEVEQP